MTYALLNASGAIAEYPVFQGDIQLRFPNTSFTNPFVPPSGYVEVINVSSPVVDRTKTVSLGAPQKVNGVWYQTWVINDLSPEELALQDQAQAEAVRIDRNRRLADCDWTHLADSPLDLDAKLAWALYRETLRMVPQQEGFPWDVKWPPKPGAI